MRAALRRVCMAAMATNHGNTTMEPSPRLRALAQQLRLYKAPTTTSSAAADEDEEIDDRGKVFSQVGLPESLIPAPWRPRPGRAAVLVCLFEADQSDLRVILTKRSSNLSTHSGEVSLPGGKVEEGDADEKETALREAKEEIGLDPSLVTVVTVLKPFLSKHFLRVVPVISILSNKQAFKPVINPDEVEAMFDAPLEMFLKDENRRSEERGSKGANYLVHYFDFETGNKKFLIWGLTASILIRAASIVFQRQPAFTEQIPRAKLPNCSM